jgi:hypothetical protein
VLGAFAVGQPLLDLAGRNPELLLAHGVDGGGVALLAVALALLPGLLLGAVAAAARALSRRSGTALYTLFALALTAALALQLLVAAARRAGLDGPAAGDASGAAVATGFPAWGALLVAAALAAAAGAGLAYRRWGAVRSTVLAALVALVAFPLHFLLASRAGALLHGGVAVAGGEVRVARPVPVLVLVFDELPLLSLLDAGGGVDAVRYPAFARLARQATWFRNASTVAPSTTYAVPAILTGRYPTRPRLPRAADYPRSLFTLLAASHLPNIHETQLVRLCPPELCRDEGEASGVALAALAADLGLVWLHRTLPADLARELPPVDRAWAGFAAPPAAGGAAAADGRSAAVDLADADHARAEPPRGLAAQRAGLLAGIERAGERPGLHYAHFNLPHPPWRTFPSGREYDPGAGAADGQQGSRWTREEWPVRVGWLRHLLQVGWADRVLGEILDRLERSGRWDDTLVVVTADHGASFRPGELRREVSVANQAEVLLVPLLVKLPGQRRGAVDERNAETVDVLPTIADALGADVRWPLDGASLLRPPPARTGKRLYSTHRSDLPPRRFASRPPLPASLRRQLERFGSGPPARLFASGPHPQLLGRRVAELPTFEAREASAAIEGRRAFRRVRQRAPLPALVRADLVLPTAGIDAPLAVAIDGVVRATALPYIDRWGAQRLLALVPEGALAPGRRRCDVYLIAARGDSLALGWIGGTGPAPDEVPAGEASRSADPPAAARGSAR